MVNQLRPVSGEHDWRQTDEKRGGHGGDFYARPAK
jgi:hypothetical protein